ncbi:MAG: ABC transporter substrate-binding protein [Myxococcota bacterium]
MLRTLLVSSIFLTFFASTSAFAQSGPASRYLKRQNDRINRILAQDASGEAAQTRRANQVTEILRTILDLDAMGRAALRNHWDERSEEEREEFQSLLRQLVERSYRDSLEGTLEYQVRYGDEEDDDDRVVVHTTARDSRNRRAPAVEINYRLRSEGNRYMVEDVVTDGVSMVGNYRSQFDRIIRRDGWDRLIERMRSRLGDRGGV